MTSLTPIQNTLPPRGAWPSRQAPVLFGQNIEQIQQDTYQALSRESAHRNQAESFVRDLIIENNRDPLTNVYNRRFLDRQLQHEFETAREKETPLGLLYMDLDRFKPINDLYGHEVGDAALIQFSRVLTELTPAGSYVCRLGGDEFVIIMPGRSAGETATLASEVIEKLRQTNLMDVQSIQPLLERNIAAPHWRKDFHLGTSIGLVHCDFGSEAGKAFAGETLFASNFLDLADHEQQKAKGIGRQQEKPSLLFQLASKWEDNRQRLSFTREKASDLRTRARNQISSLIIGDLD
ncbi:MAG: GGDEF domain-containing protein [Candidatus Melainabacteria bacterium]